MMAVVRSQNMRFAIVASVAFVPTPATLHFSDEPRAHLNANRQNLYLLMLICAIKSMNFARKPLCEF